MYYKRIGFALLTFFCITLFAQATPTLPAMDLDHPSRKTIQYREQDPGKKQIIIVTNLEDVLIRKDWFSIFTSTAHKYFKANNKLQLTKLLFSYSFLHDCYLVTRKELYDNGKHMLHKSDYIAYFARTYPALAPHEAALFDIVHEYALDEEMIAFYLWLKISKNYALYVATNKDRASYRIIKKKLDTSLLKRFGIGWNDLFDGAFYVDKLDASGDRFTQSAKPDASYFLGMWNYLRTKRNYTKESAHLMYVDDAEQNILAAQATHHEYDIPIDGVYFKRCDQIKHAISLLSESLEKGSGGCIE